jgi:hypothetical protein
MPVRRVSAKEILGSKMLVMSANPSVLQQLKNLALQKAQDRR